MSDPLLISTPDGLEIECIGGVVTMSDGLVNAALLSLVGNEDDPGRADKRKQYWANFIQATPERRLRSEFAYLSNSIPLTSGNRQLLEEAAQRDLAWMTRRGADGAPPVADEVRVSVTYPSRRSLLLEGNIVANGRDYPFQFERTQ